MNRFPSLVALSFLLLFASTAFADSAIIPINKSPTRGSSKGTITIVSFGSFQCPYTKRAQATLKQLLGETDVRIVAKHHPLPFHKNSEHAARAATAADSFGKYWEMHDLLFETQMEWSRMSSDEFEKFAISNAGVLGIDTAKFAKSMNSKQVKRRVDTDTKLAATLGSRGTPSFYINGIKLVGAQPHAKFMEIIKTEREAIKKAKKSDYARRVKANYSKQKPFVSKSGKAPTVDVQLVPLRSDAPVIGSKKADVKLVVFGDYQCPFTNRFMTTIGSLENKYGKEISIEWRHNPLPFHKEAPQAAWAAEAARVQGKFWEMSGLIFENQKELKSRSGDIDRYLESLAESLKLDMKKFRASYRNSDLRQRVETDKKLAAEIGARGTPNTFVNGIKFVGAKPLDKAVELIEEQMKVAQRVRKKTKKKGGALYQAVVKQNEQDAKKVNAQ